MTRALTNYAGNAVATVLVGHWNHALDLDRAQRVLAGDEPFDEAAFAAGDTHADHREPASAAASR